MTRRVNPPDPDGESEPRNVDPLDRPLVGGRYRIDDDSPLGSGGMGEVWRATDTLLNRTVALKQVRIASLGRAQVEEMRERALREGRIAARLHHPNVVMVFDVLVADDRLWLVLEYVPSRSADKLLAAEGPLPYHRVARIGAQIAEALTAAHAAGIRHRDVKPGNVLVDSDGGAKLADFGISRAVNDLQLTSAGVIPGTLAYLAPEVAQGEEFTNAADVYGLGATLYALTEGTPPFGSGDPHNPMRLLHQIATGEVPAPTRAGPLTAALTRLTDPNPERRPDAATARDLLAAVAPGWDVPLASAPTLVGLRRLRFTRPRILATTALLLITTAALVASFTLPPRAHDTPSPAAAPPTAVLTAAEQKYIPDVHRFEPCDIMDISDYTRFGSATKYTSDGFHGCVAKIALNGGGTATVGMHFFASADRSGGDGEQRGDLIVYRPGPGDFSIDCAQLIGLPGSTAIYITNEVTNSNIEPCAPVEAAANTLLRYLSSPPLPGSDAAGDPNSLRRRNACQLLDSAELRAAVPDLDSTKVYPEFGNWRCIWGKAIIDPHFGPPAAQVYFKRGVPLAAGKNGMTLERIADRDVFIQLQSRTNDQTMCTAGVVYRRTTHYGEPLEEEVEVGVYAAVPYNQQCQMARELIVKVIPRLSAP